MSTMLSVSSDGSVTVLLPNKLMQDNAIQPNKLYALFGDDTSGSPDRRKKAG